jgi:hypothetical protein
MPNQKIAGLQTQDDVNTVIRCLVGQGKDEDFEKVAILGLLGKGAKKVLEWTVKNPGKAATTGVFIAPAAIEAKRRAQSAAVRPAGYHPVSGYYLPQGRVQ